MSYDPDKTRSPLPVVPPPHVVRFATALGSGVDAYLKHQPMSYMEVLQGLEYLRFCVTETVIRRHNNNKNQPPKN